MVHYSLGWSRGYGRALHIRDVIADESFIVTEGFVGVGFIGGKSQDHTFWIIL
jgi:hypothetical protein